MDAGRPKTRRRYTGIMRKVKVTMMLANNKDGGANEKAIALRTFYEGAGDGVANTGGCDGGYLYFKFVSPLDGVRHFYRFTKPPEITNTGPLNFISTMEWEEL